MMLTRSGQFRIFDITEFLPGQPIPADYFRDGICSGPWYFMPAGWKAPEWCGTSICRLRKFPMAYSPGFETAEEALAAAEEWESNGYVRIQEERAARGIWADDNGEIHIQGEAKTWTL